jgi:hypothetical protein
MQIMTGRQQTAGVIERPRKAVSLTGLGNFTQRRHRRPATVHERGRTINWNKVRAARQRLAAGRYDRENLFDNVVEIIFATFTE